MKESSVTLSFWNRIRDRFLPKSRLSCALIILALLGGIFICYVSYQQAKLPFQGSIIFTNAPRIKGTVYPIQLRLSGKELRSEKKFQFFEINEKEFEEKNFPLVFAELASVRIDFWGLDNEGNFHVFRYPVSQNNQRILKITEVSLEKLKQGRIDVSYEKNWEMILIDAITSTSLLCISLAFIVAINVFVGIRRNEKKFNAIFGKTGEAKA